MGWKVKKCQNTFTKGDFNVKVWWIHNSCLIANTMSFAACLCEEHVPVTYAVAAENSGARASLTAVRPEGPVRVDVTSTRSWAYVAFWKT